MFPSLQIISWNGITDKKIKLSSKSEIRDAVRVLFAENVPTMEICCLVAVYGENVMSVQMICKWSSAELTLHTFFSKNRVENMVNGSCTDV